MLGRQSQYLEGPAQRDVAIEAPLNLVEQDPSLVDKSWTLYTLAPTSVEFWQADASRAHTRLNYERNTADAPWEHHLLWP
ncbi:pyridoxine 5'-phosphate oxidase C-terminal domain-containing protein [Streptomyces sp. S1]|uniref:pyridoxine 5'-phosphate oxidase C-terminal domain-containing protein n=1 Tax=Streptomyces sp. S1 TaxID=718288 RepID=UPI003D74F160